MIKPLAAIGEVIKNLFTKPVTSAYPFEKVKPDAKFRGQIKFKPTLCVGCQLCVRNCPANAIKIIQINPQDKPTILPDGKVLPVLRKFKCEIDLGRCIFCGQCADSCFKKAIYSSQDFELASIDKKDLADIMDYPAQEPKPTPQEAEQNTKEAPKDAAPNV